jgi:hypothetical protein
VTPREQLEYAAKAMGKELRIVLPNYSTAPEYFSLDGITQWNPLTDQADSDRMACKLRIEVQFDGVEVFAAAPRSADVFATVKHNNTDEDVCRAVREARLAVAVEIGRMK